MKSPGPSQLSRRERQIMDIIWRDGRATASEVLERLHDPPGYSAVRALLRVLETKGHLRHEADGTRYVYLPMVAPQRASKSAMANLVQTFFAGSAEKAVAALLDLSRDDLSDKQLERLSKQIEDARKEGR